MDPTTFQNSATGLADAARKLATQADRLAGEALQLTQAKDAGGGDPLVFGLTVFVLACFVGYYVVWRVTPALHSPLMSVTNAISSVIVVGALLAAGASHVAFSKTLGLVSVALAAVNIFGGFVVTQRMLGKFRKKEAKAK